MSDMIDVNQLSNAIQQKVDLPSGKSQADIDYVVESQLPTAANSYTWYRLYKSGWVEQGGIKTIAGSTSPSATSITFPITMADSNYTLTIGSGVGSSGWQYANGCTVEGKGVSGFSPRCATGSGNTVVNWQLSGISAQGGIS